MRRHTICAYTPGWPEGFATLPEAQYVLAHAMWTPELPVPENVRFVESYKKRYGEIPKSYWAPLAYANITSVLDAIKRAGITDKEAVKKALAETDLPSPLGKNVKFSPSRYCKYQCFTEWYVGQWQNGKLQVVLPENVATAKLVYPVPAWKERK